MAEYKFENIYLTGDKNVVAGYLFQVVEPGTDEFCNDDAVIDRFIAGDGVKEGERVCEIDEAVTKEDSGLQNYEPSFERKVQYLSTMNGVQVLVRDFQRVKIYSLTGETLMRKTKYGLRVVATIQKRQHVLHAVHDKSGHLRTKTRIAFITRDFWWLIMHCNAGKNPCSSAIAARWENMLCQSNACACNMSLDYFTLFNGLFCTNANNGNGKRYMLVAVEHFTGWQIVYAVRLQTSVVAIMFFEREVET